MLGETTMEGLALINTNFKPWPYHILTSMGMSERAWELTKHEVVIQINPTKPIDYTMMQAHEIVTHATSYDVLVRSVVLYL
jgi:hypothetical protein